jgi:hypothetical protein
MISTSKKPTANSSVLHLQMQGRSNQNLGPNEQTGGDSNTVVRAAGACEFALPQMRKYL